MTLGNKIAQCRKALSITQDALAQQLGVTNQAVSKWESDQCCPDVTLLPKIADIFGITIDELFGREPQPAKEASQKESSGFDFKKVFGISLEALDAKANQKKREDAKNVPPPSWPDDETLRVVAYIGHKLVQSTEALEKLTFQYEGPALNIHSHISVTCGDVEGDVDAGRDISCINVEGDVDAGRDVNCSDVSGDIDAGKAVSCGNVEGNVSAGSSVSCGNVEGDVDAGSHVGCGSVCGDVDAGTDVKCGDVGGDVNAGAHISCGQVGGNVEAGTDVKCGDVGGDVDAGGNVECTKVEGDIDAGGTVTVRK